MAAVLALATAACGVAPGASSPETPSPAPSTASEMCPQIELLTPAGTRIDLNGTWLAEKEGIRNGVYYFRQVGSCVWFAGAFTPPADLDGTTALRFMTVVFRGTVRADFTIHGDWIDARNQVDAHPGNGGSIDLAIEVGADGSLRLVYTGGTGQPFLEPGYRESQSWIRISGSSKYPPEELMP